MGCYDIVRVPCPKCKTIYRAQSKGGKCSLLEYSLRGAPSNVMMDVNRHAPFTCPKCGELFRVKCEIAVVYATSVYEGEYDDEEFEPEE